MARIVHSSDILTQGLYGDGSLSLKILDISQCFCASNSMTEQRKENEFG